MIDIQNVNKSFKGSPAIQDLTLEVKEGEILGLLGANGAGKSTTINMLLGFLAPDSGTVSINQLDMTQKADQARKFVGYIPENVNLYPSKTELEGFLTTCGLLAEYHPKKVSDYSKGMRQKVGIAIAYAKKAKVYLLDEPASGLDPLASNELSELLKKLASEGATILMASHDIFRVREVCNRIGILKKGILVKELRSEEVTANELEKLYLKFINN
jgi:ABC-2 type transport system ATP-binding protein